MTVYKKYKLNRKLKICCLCRILNYHYNYNKSEYCKECNYKIKNKLPITNNETKEIFYFDKNK